MRPNYQFLFHREIREFHRINVDLNVVLIVEGNGDWATYEWRIEGGSASGEHSNCGYGNTAIALRDGLIAYYGTPDEGTERRSG